YDKALSKSDNLQTLVELVENRPEHRNIIVMLDMYHPPERTNTLSQNPFPHYDMLHATQSPDQWLMLDPDFRWEGRLPKAKILNAVAQPTVAGGYYFDGIQITHTPTETIQAYFAQCMKRHENPFTQAIRQVVVAHVASAGGL